MNEQKTETLKIENVNEDNEENRLTALIALYNAVVNDILFFQNKGDSPDIVNFVPVLIIPLLQIFKANSFFVLIVCLMGPVLQMMSLQRGLQSHTFIAMLRGYAADIEDSINEIIGKKHFIYNSILIDKYIASDKIVKNKGMKTSWFATAIMQYALIIISWLLLLYFNTYDYWWFYVLTSMWYVFMTIIILKLSIKFAEKERKRYDSRDTAKDYRENK